MNTTIFAIHQMSADSLYEKCHAFGWLPNEPTHETQDLFFWWRWDIRDGWLLEPETFFYVDYIILHIKKKFAVVRSTHFWYLVVTRKRDTCAQCKVRTPDPGALTTLPVSSLPAALQTPRVRRRTSRVPSVQQKSNRIVIFEKRGNPRVILKSYDAEYIFLFAGILLF